MKRTSTLDLDTLGGQITHRRQSAGLSLNELAREAGVAKGYLSEIENGKAPRPGVYVVQRIAIALGVSIEALIGVPRARRQPERVGGWISRAEAETIVLDMMTPPDQAGEPVATDERQQIV
jgi:transcriptional regulator with XRE-family HTH domain